MSKEGYRPSAEEIKKAEDSMTPEQKIQTEIKIRSQSEHDIKERHYGPKLMSSMHNLLEDLEKYKHAVSYPSYYVDNTKGNKQMKAQLNEVIKKAQEIMDGMADK